MLAGIRNKHASPPRQKEAILRDDFVAMLETLDRGTLRGLRDRAILLLGFAGGLRRSEIVGLDCSRDQTEDGRGWIEFFPDKGVLVTLRGKTGWREVETGLVRRHLPRRNLGNLAEIRPDRVRATVPARHRERKIGRRRAAQRPGGRTSGQTDRAGSRRPRRSAGRRARPKVFGAFATRRPRLLRRGRRALLQKQLGHASAEMTRKYQRRRDRFRVNLTKASRL
ncbi:MAG: hypothetical protein EOS20_27375 [Mesorhizobium sp.]|nr:MAG: hypothetical protein EOS20_27375 [Mesorhizobium sp.]